MNWVAVFIANLNTWSNLAISTHKLGVVSTDTKFIQGSTSNYKLAVKISAKNSKAWVYEKCSKQNVLKWRWNSTEQSTKLMKVKIWQNWLHMLMNVL